MVVEPDTGSATMAELTKPADPDDSNATAGARLVVTAPAIDAGAVEVLGDSAYATGDMVAVLDAKQWTRWSSRGRSGRPCLRQHSRR